MVSICPSRSRIFQSSFHHYLELAEVVQGEFGAEGDVHELRHPRVERANQGYREHALSWRLKPHRFSSCKVSGTPGKN